MSGKANISWRNGLPSSVLTIKKSGWNNCWTWEAYESKKGTNRMLPKIASLVCFLKIVTWIWGKLLLLVTQMPIHNSLLTMMTTWKGTVLLVWMGKTSCISSVFPPLEFGCNCKFNNIKACVSLFSVAVFGFSLWDYNTLSLQFGGAKKACFRLSAVAGMLFQGASCRILTVTGDGSLCPSVADAPLLKSGSSLAGKNVGLFPVLSRCLSLNASSPPPGCIAWLHM